LACTTKSGFYLIDKIGIVFDPCKHSIGILLQLVPSFAAVFVQNSGNNNSKEDQMVMLKIMPSASKPKNNKDLSNDRHRQLIGYLGLALPWLLILIVRWRDGWSVWEGLDSVSAYYYTGANALFVGMLFVLGLFLSVYEGYDNKFQKWDRRFARIAAVASVLVAFFPTKAPQVKGITPLLWWRRWIGDIHFGAAIVLFVVFAVFCLWLFRATEKSAAKPERANETIPDPDPNKKRRNHFYALCGVLIISCIIWAGYSHVNDKPIFWPEAIALTCFALSWLVKGYWLRSIAELPGVKPVAKFTRSLLSPKGPGSNLD
jgi:hypothetical protein